MSKAQIKESTGKRWKKMVIFFWEKVCPKKIYNLYFHEPRSYPNFGGKRPSYPTHSSPFFWGCVADPTLRPSMSGVAARVRDIAQSREIQLSLLQKKLIVFFFNLGARWRVIFFKDVITVRLYWTDSIIYLISHIHIYIYIRNTCISMYTCIYEIILFVYHAKGVSMCRCKMESTGVIWAGETLFNFKVWQRTTENKYKRVANI